MSVVTRRSYKVMAYYRLIKRLVAACLIVAVYFSPLEGQGFNSRRLLAGQTETDGLSSLGNI